MWLGTGGVNEARNRQVVGLAFLLWQEAVRIEPTVFAGRPG
jgi:hypothetical protein